MQRKAGAIDMKKWISAVLSIAMLMSFGVNAYADTESETEADEENGKIYTGVIFDTDRSQEFTEEELLKLEEKLEAVEKLTCLCKKCAQIYHGGYV